MTSDTQPRTETSDQRFAIQWLLIALWCVTMVTLPILRWEFGSDIIAPGVLIALLTKWAAVTFVLVVHMGMAKTLRMLALVSILTWSVEYIGSHTGLPFGDYSYTNVLQPQLGNVPLVIPFAWFAMLPVCWSIAQLITDGTFIKYTLVSAVAMTAWDLFLDPQMVGWGFWIWHEEGQYFGIPLINYAGWLLTTCIVTLLVRPFREHLPVLPLLTIYGIVWFLQSVGQAFFWNQPGPAITGSVVMGAILLASLRQYRNLRADDDPA